MLSQLCFVSFIEDPTGDGFLSRTTPESIFDEHGREIINMEPEDRNTLVDLREVKR